MAAKWWELGIEWWALGIAVIALLAALLKDFVIPWIFQPKLTLEGKNDDECVDNALGEMYTTDMGVITSNPAIKM